MRLIRTIENDIALKLMRLSNNLSSNRLIEKDLKILNEELSAAKAKLMNDNILERVIYEEEEQA